MPTVPGMNEVLRFFVCFLIEELQMWDPGDWSVSDLLFERASGHVQHSSCSASDFFSFLSSDLSQFSCCQFELYHEGCVCGCARFLHQFFGTCGRVPSVILVVHLVSSFDVASCRPYRSPTVESSEAIHH